MTTPTVPPPPQDEQVEFSPRTKKILTITLSVVLVAIFGGFATYIVVKVLNPPPPAYAEGDCVMVVEGGQLNAKVEKIGCGERDALYQVARYLDEPDGSCPNDSYSEYSQTGGKTQEFKLCLVLNAAEGDCLKVPMITMGEEKKVACSSGEANRKVTKVIDGTADNSACEPESAEDARVYPDPKRTVCIGPVGA